MAPTAPGELGGLQPPNPGGVDTPLTNPSWIFQAGGHRLHSPGHRAPWRASRPHLPVASAPTTTPPACGASMTPRLDHPPKKVLPHPRNPILGFSQIAVGGIKTLCNVIGLPPHFGGFLHPKGWQEGFGWSGVVTWPAAAGGLYESGFQVFPASFGMTQLICGREIRAGLWWEAGGGGGRGGRTPQGGQPWCGGHLERLHPYLPWPWGRGFVLQGVAFCRVPGDVRNHRGTPHQFKDPHPVKAFTRNSGILSHQFRDSPPRPGTPHPVSGWERG